MKQKKFGKKVINWHRPLSVKQQAQGYVKRRLELPNLIDQDFPEDYIETDECWNPYDPCCRCGDYYEGCYHDNAFDYSVWSLEEYIRGILHSPTLLNPDEGSLNRPWKLGDAGLLSPEVVSPFRIETRLSEFFKNVSGFIQDPHDLQTQIEQSLADTYDRRMLKLAADQMNHPQLAIQIGLFSSFWIRSPRAWNQGTNFLDHVFAQYPVPHFLHSEWTEYSPNFKWLFWFILLGQGGSLKRAGDLIGWCIPAKLPNYLNEVPVDFLPVAACMMAEVKRLGGHDIDFSRLHGNIAYVIDTTEPSEDKAYLRFWQNTVRWLVRNREAISDEEAHHILNWGMHEFTEGQRPEGTIFSWKGRRVPSVLERSLQYRRETERLRQRYQWCRHGWDWELEDSSLGTWTAIELTSGEELYHEGQAQNHCVAGYAGRCVAGHSAIVSLQQDDKRRLTVEINPSTGQIVQARGQYNRKANATEQQVLSQWMQTVVYPSKSNENERKG